MRVDLASIWMKFFQQLHSFPQESSLFSSYPPVCWRKLLLFCKSALERSISIDSINSVTFDVITFLLSDILRRDPHNILQDDQKVHV